MWFKQVQLFHLTDVIQSSPTFLAEKLEPLSFKPCLPSLPSSMGFVSPLDEENAPLARGLNGCIMFCLQLEEKILPASVVTQALKEKIKKVEQTEDRKMRKKEKLSLKDELTQTLLTRAFSKLTRIYAYIDTRHQWLILNSISPAKTELFLSVFKKAFGDGIEPVNVVKPSSIITDWLKHKNYPEAFSIEKACILQDPNQQHRIIRCQQQDLFSEGIQSLVKEGCEAIQIALNWHDKMNFVIAPDFTLRSIRLSEDDIVEIQDEMETKQQKFDADFIMMTEMYAGLIKDLLDVFASEEKVESVKKLALVG